VKKLEPLAKGGKKPPPPSEQRAAITHKGHYLDLTISYLVLVSVPNLHLHWLKMGRKGCYRIGLQMNSRILIPCGKKRT